MLRRRRVHVCVYVSTSCTLGIHASHFCARATRTIHCVHSAPIFLLSPGHNNNYNNDKKTRFLYLFFARPFCFRVVLLFLGSARNESNTYRSVRRNLPSTRMCMPERSCVFVCVIMECRFDWVVENDIFPVRKHTYSAAVTADRLVLFSRVRIFIFIFFFRLCFP